MNNEKKQNLEGDGWEARRLQNVVHELNLEPSDAPLVFVDGVKGVLVQNAVTKISFFQQTIAKREEGGLASRQIVTLIIPNDQLKAIASLLTTISDENPYPAIEIKDLSS